MSKNTFLVVVFMLLAYIAIQWGVAHYFKSVIGPATALIVAALAISGIACLFLLRWKRNMLTRAYYVIGVVWLGLSFIALMIILIAQLSGLILGHNISVPTVLAIISLIAVFSLFNAFVPKVKQMEFNIKKKFKPMRIVQLSDIHMGEIYTPRHLKKIVSQTNKLNADVVVITGDLFDGGEIYPGMVDSLGDLKAKHVLFITGNHEIYTGVEKTIQKVKATGVTVLDNEIVTINGVQFCGFSHPEKPGDERETLKALAKKIDKKKPAILLRHIPEDAKLAEQLGFDLQLSGHTHRAQVWPLSYLVLLMYPIMSGLYTKNNFTLYVSQGTGTWGPPFRLGSRSEITLIKIN